MSHLPSFSLTGKRALVTGGAAGIGRAIALAMAEAGADVVITRHSRPADETAEKIRAMGRNAQVLATDLGALDQRGAEDLIAQAEEAGPLDILVNNAGIIRREDAENHSEEDWRAVMGTNLDALWYLSRAAGASMLGRGSGRIVQIASLLSFQGGIRVPGYAAAKHGVAGLTKALANEWAGRGVGVNAIAPGYIATDNTQALREDPVRSAEILGRIPAGRWGDPADIAGAAVFLGSDAAAYIHGHILTVDGGWMAR